MRSTIWTVVTAFLALGCLPNAHGSFINVRETREDLCYSLLSQSSAALLATDGPGALVLNVRAKSACSAIADEEITIVLHDQAASAYSSLERWSEMLAETDQCIRRQYAATGCREHRVAALESLNRIPEAIREADLTIKLAQQNAMSIRRSADNSREASSKLYMNEKIERRVERVLQRLRTLPRS